MRYLKKALYLIVLIGYSFSYAGSYDDFFAALERDDVRTVEPLLQRGFDPNTVDPQGRHALLRALQKSSWAVAQLLLAQPSTQVEVRSSQDESPLMLAALKGQTEICRQLIAREADVNKPGWTPLHYAASNGDPELLRLLLDHFAYADAESPNGSTPLMMAAMYGSTEAVQLLLDAGADPTIKNALGLGALAFAQRAGHADAVQAIAKALRARQPTGSW
jgi:ankyrin repeat protein